jgi:hypothetical protein
LDREVTESHRLSALCGGKPLITSRFFQTDRPGSKTMEGPLRGLLAGAAAWKFGGGCISTILIFIIVFWLLGYVHC